MSHYLFRRLVFRYGLWWGLLLLTSLAASVRAAEPIILVFGDSLSAGYGIARQDSWPALLEERLRQEKFNWRVVNASISGETTAGGASRIGQALRQHQPDLLILALGANDGLRGLPIAEMKRNLAAIMSAAGKQRAKVLLVGMRLPPNYGPIYGQEFATAFSTLARAQRVAVVPFMMAGFADRPEYFLADGLHPNRAAQALILETIWDALLPMLRRS